MKSICWILSLIAAALVLSSCSPSGGQDSSGGTAAPGTPAPGPKPGPAPKTLISQLSDQNISRIHACMLGAWLEDSAYWTSIGGASLLKCLNIEIRIQQADLTPQFELDFADFFHELHDETGKFKTNLSIASLRRAIFKGERK